MSYWLKARSFLLFTYYFLLTTSSTMKQTWENFTETAQSFKTHFEELLEMLPQSAKFYAKQQALIKQWKKFKNDINLMDDFISPTIKSVKVTNGLLKDADFSATWKFWKDYLIEQHAVYMRSRTELMALKRLSDISGEKPTTAIRFLEFAMSRGDKNFYIVHEKEKPATEVAKNEKGGTIIELPSNYQKTSNSSNSPLEGDTEGREVK